MVVSQPIAIKYIIHVKGNIYKYHIGHILHILLKLKIAINRRVCSNVHLFLF